MQRMIMLMLSGVLAATLSLAGGPPPALTSYTCEGNLFRAQVPAAWERSERTAPYADMTTVSGAQFAGPANADQVPATISLYYYSGERNFTTPEAYINARLGSMVREDAERGKVTSPMRIAGRQATEFRMKTFELVTVSRDVPVAGAPGDPRVYELAPLSRKVIVEEQYIVVPASKGFFVLHYRSPEGLAEANQPIFDQVTASFEPLVP